MRKKSLRKKSLRKNDNGGSSSKMMYKTQLHDLTKDSTIFKKIWGNDKIKEKYCSHYETPFDKPDNYYSTANFNKLLAEATDKDVYKKSVKEYYTIPREQLLFDLNKFIKDGLYTDTELVKKETEIIDLFFKMKL